MIKLKVDPGKSRRVYELSLEEYMQKVVSAYNRELRKGGNFDFSSYPKTIEDLPSEYFPKYKAIHNIQVRKALVDRHLPFYIADFLNHLDVYPYLKVYHERGNIPVTIDKGKLKMVVYNDLIGVHKTKDKSYDVYLVNSQLKVNGVKFDKYIKCLALKNKLLVLGKNLAEEPLRKDTRDHVVRIYIDFMENDYKKCESDFQKNIFK